MGNEDKKTREVSKLVAMEEVTLQDGEGNEVAALVPVIDANEGFTKMSELRKAIKKLEFVNVKLLIFRDTGGVIEYEEVTVIKEKV